MKPLKYVKMLVIIIWSVTSRHTVPKWANYCTGGAFNGMGHFCHFTLFFENLVMARRRPYSEKILLKIRQLSHREALFLYHRTAPWTLQLWPLYKELHIKTNFSSWNAFIATSEKWWLVDNLRKRSEQAMAWAYKNQSFRTFWIYRSLTKCQSE